MKYFLRNIIHFLLLIIIVIYHTSCNELSKSQCEEVLNYSYSDNDSLLNKTIVLADKCVKKYHKNIDLLQKNAQLLYFDAVNKYSSNDLLSSTKGLFNALSNINEYMSQKNEIKSYEYIFRGEIYERIGDIYKEINSLKQASELYNKALTDYESSDNAEKVANILIKTGRLYQYNHINDIALIYFEMAEEIDNIPSKIYRKIIDNKLVSLYESNDYKTADSIYNYHFNIKIQDYDFHSAVGTKYFYEREYVKAIPHLKYCFENGNQQEKLSASEKLAEAYFNINDQENEMKYIQHQAEINSIEIRKTPLKLDLEITYDTYYLSYDTTSRKEKSTSLNFLYIIILLIVITIFTILLVIRRKQYKEKIRKVEEKISDNQEIIQSKDKIIDNISKKLVELESINTKIEFDDAYNTFCNSPIYIKIKTSIEGLNIMIKNVQEYSKYALSNNDLIQLTIRFNDCFPNITSSIKEDYEGIKTSDIRFLILSFMSFNDMEIAVLLGLTYGASNKRSNKLKNIFKTEEDISDFLLRYIKSKI